MNISLNWLKEFVSLPEDLTAKELGLKLTMSTVEVEGVNSSSENFVKIVVGKVKKIDNHPNADRLKVVEVDIGEKTVQIVCGGSNLVLNSLVAVALPGAKVKWHGEGELVIIEKSKVRGVESEGMICASTEIGLEDRFPISEEHEILDFSEKGLNFAVGENLADVLDIDETVFEIDNKSVNNRPDLWGHYGLARELSAIYQVPLKSYPQDKFKFLKQEKLKVEVKEKNACPRYQAVVLNGIKVKDSPTWIQKRLLEVGQKPINNIVDITNFVMFELGQPLHAFSFDSIQEKIVIRKAVSGEKFLALDEVERELTEDDLVIADQEKVLALAGVVGGFNSGIKSETTKIVIESANFEPVGIRKTANRYNLRTEAAVRFEKSLDPLMTELAINRVVSLLLADCPDSEIVTEFIDVNSYKENKIELDIGWDFVDRKIGNELDRELVVNFLRRLGFGVKEKKKGFSLKVPSWRATKDISIKEDIIEEITRIFGYDNLRPIMPKVSLAYTEENGLRTLERKIKEFLAFGAGANEIYNYSFTDGEFLKKIGMPLDLVEVANPWSAELKYLRKSLVPGILKNLMGNRHLFPKMKIFEVGKTFNKLLTGEEVRPGLKEFLPRQDLFCAVAVYGADAVFRLKGMVEALFENLFLELSFEVDDEFPLWAHPGQSVKMFLEKEEIGTLCGIHPETKDIFDLPDEVAIVEFNLSKVLPFFPVQKKYVATPKFPPIVLDVSIIVDSQVDWGKVEKLVKSFNPELIKGVELLEVYKDDKIGVDKKSFTFRLTYLSEDRTLVSEEVAKIQKSLLEHLAKALGAVIRQ